MISEQNILQTDLDEIKKILHRVSVIFFLHFKSPEVVSPGTRVMLPEIHSHVARNPKSCRPQFYRVYKLEEK